MYFTLKFCSFYNGSDPTEVPTVDPTTDPTTDPTLNPTMNPLTMGLVDMFKYNVFVFLIFGI